MHVGIICGAGIVSGKEIMALELAEGLRGRGWPVDVAYSFWGDGDFSRRLKAKGFSSHPLRLGFISATLNLEYLWMTMVQMGYWPALLRGYHRFVRSTLPERVVHTNWHHLLLLWPLLERERDVFWLHEVVPDKAQYRRVFGWLAGRIGCFVAVSQAVAESLSVLGIPKGKIHLVHNGLSDPGPIVAVRRREGPRVGIVGRIGAWKGHQDLLEAFARITTVHADAELHIFGSGTPEFEAALRRQAEELGIARRLTWHGFIAERSAIYPIIDICVVPSRSEDPLPTVAIEAAFFGVPVVASRRGGLPEIVEHGTTGLLFEPGDLGQLAAQMSQLLASAERRTTMGGAARSRALAHFGAKRFTAEFARLLEGPATP